MKIIPLTKVDYKFLSRGGEFFDLYVIDKNKDFKCTIIDSSDKAVLICVVDDNKPHSVFWLPKAVIYKVDNLEELYINRWVKIHIIREAKCTILYDYKIKDLKQA